MLFFEAAIQANGQLSIIYATEVLHLSVVQVTIGFGVAAIISVLGALASASISFVFPPKRLTEISLVLFIGIVIANGYFVEGFTAALVVFAVGGLIVGFVSLSFSASYLLARTILV